MPTGVHELLRNLHADTQSSTGISITTKPQNRDRKKRDE